MSFKSYSKLLIYLHMSIFLLGRVLAFIRQILTTVLWFPRRVMNNRYLEDIMRSEKNISHKCTDIAWFHLYDGIWHSEIHSESRMVAAAEAEWNDEAGAGVCVCVCVINGYRTSVWEDEKVLVLGSGDDCTTMYKCLKSQICTLKNS